MKIRHLLFSGCLAAGLLAPQSGFAQEDVALKDKSTIEFEEAVQLMVDGNPVKVEAPGYACPSLADLNGDGHKDLLVGQFMGGKIKVYPNDGENRFQAGKWLQIDDKAAEIPGVW